MFEAVCVVFLLCMLSSFLACYNTRFEHNLIHKMITMFCDATARNSLSSIIMTFSVCLAKLNLQIIKNHNCLHCGAPCYQYISYVFCSWASFHSVLSVCFFRAFPRHSPVPHARLVAGWMYVLYVWHKVWLVYGHVWRAIWSQSVWLSFTFPSFVLLMIVGYTGYQLFFLHSGVFFCFVCTFVCVLWTWFNQRLTMQMLKFWCSRLIVVIVKM